MTPAGGGRLAASLMTPGAGAAGMAGDRTTRAASRMSAPIRVSRLERCLDRARDLAGSRRPGNHRPGNHRPRNHGPGNHRCLRHRRLSHRRTGPRVTGPRLTGLLAAGRPRAGSQRLRRVLGAAAGGSEPGRRTVMRLLAAGCRPRRVGLGTGLPTLRLRPSGVLIPDTRVSRRQGQGRGPGQGLVEAPGTAILGWAARWRPDRRGLTAEPPGRLRYLIQGSPLTRGSAPIPDWPRLRRSAPIPELPWIPELPSTPGWLALDWPLAPGQRQIPGVRPGRQPSRFQGLGRIRDCRMTPGSRRVRGPRPTRHFPRIPGSRPLRETPV